jgi:hypothetical protein
MPHARILALATVLAAVLAGCGSGSSSTGGSNGNGGVEMAAVQSPLLETSGNVQASHDYIVKSSDTINTKQGPSIARYPTGHDNDEISETGTSAIDPCDLVSTGQATAILGGSPRITQEPQGPTCVYAMGRSGPQVTLAIESTRLSSLRGHARGTSQIQIGGKTGWCLRYGSTSVAVPLSGGRVLHTTGPCATAGRFAALALHAIASRGLTEPQQLDDDD